MSGAYGGAAYGGAAFSPVVGQSSFSGTFPYSVVTEIAFASNPLDDPAVWTDVSLYVQSIHTNRGRQHELNRFDAGTATVVLMNLDGRFSPFNASSPYSPNVLPYKQIRVRALYNGVYYPIFRGHIEAWPVKWPTPNESTVTVSAVDAQKILNLKRASQFTPTYQTTVLADSPTALYMLNDSPSSTTAVDSSGNGNTATLLGLGGSPPAFLGAASNLTADASASFDCGTKNGNGALFTNGEVSTPITLRGTNDWTIEMWVYPRSTPTSGGDYLCASANGTGYVQVALYNDLTVHATISDGTTVLSLVSSSKLQLNQPNFVTVSWFTASKNIQIGISGQQDSSATNTITTGTVANSMFFGLGDYTVQAAAIWSTSNILGTKTLNHYLAGAQPLSGQKTGQRITSLLNAVGYPASLQKVATGLISCQPGSNDLVTNTALANIQVAADTELGDLFIGADGSVVFYDHLHKYASPNGVAALTLGDSGVTGPGGESPYLLSSVDIAFDDLDIYNDAQVTPAKQGAQTASDATSQTSYGKRTTSRSGVHANGADALGEAQWLVGKYKTPLQRIRSVSFTPLSDPTVLLPAALGFELLTRLTVKRRPKDGAGSTFSQDSLIEGIEHSIVPGMWTTTYRLSPTDASPIPWIIDDPVAGKIVDGGSQSPAVVIGF